MGVHALLAEQGPRGGNWSLCTHYATSHYQDSEA
jgi:hypothetical protein